MRVVAVRDKALVVREAADCLVGMRTMMQDGDASARVQEFVAMSRHSLARGTCS